MSNKTPKCNVCKLPITKDLPGSACRGCELMCHCASMQGKSRESFKCERCQDPPPMDLEDPPNNRFSFAPPLALSSTGIAPNRLSREDILEAQVAELTTLVKTLLTGNTRGQAQTGPAENNEPGASNQRNNAAAEQSSIDDGSGRAQRQLTRSQEAMMASMRVEPVTRL